MDYSYLANGFQNLPDNHAIVPIADIKRYYKYGALVGGIIGDMDQNNNISDRYKSLSHRQYIHGHGKIRKHRRKNTHIHDIFCSTCEIRLVLLCSNFNRKVGPGKQQIVYFPQECHKPKLTSSRDSSVGDSILTLLTYSYTTGMFNYTIHVQAQ